MPVKKSKRTQSGQGGRPNRTVKHEKLKTIDEYTTLLPEIPLVDIEADEEQESDSDTTTIRDSVKEMLVKNTKNLAKWLEDVGKDNPARALAIYKELMESFIPKLSRTDSKMTTDSPIRVIFQGVDVNNITKE